MAPARRSPPSASPGSWPLPRKRPSGSASRPRSAPMRPDRRGAARGRQPGAAPPRTRRLRLERLAQAEATRLRRTGRAEGEAATTAATVEALEIVARAEESAGQIVAEAADVRRDDARAESEDRARGLLRTPAPPPTASARRDLELVCEPARDEQLAARQRRAAARRRPARPFAVAGPDRAGGAGDRRLGSRMLVAERRPSGRRSERDESASDGERLSTPVDDGGLDVPEFIPPG